MGVGWRHNRQISAEFLGAACNTFLTLGYWNINAVRSKLEADFIVNKLQKFDLIWIAEIKSHSNVYLPGFYSYRNVKRYTTHGGIVLMVKNHLVSQVNSVKFYKDDGISIVMKNCVDVVFSGWYVPPEDSPYYDAGIFSSINETLYDGDKKYILLGDFNAKIKNYNDLLGELIGAYDLVNEPYNHHGDLLRSICVENKLYLLNGLSKNNATFDSSLTYRKKNTWVSRLDFCCVSSTLIGDITSFSVDQSSELPSDHAFISIQISVKNLEDPKLTLYRAERLGRYDVVQKGIITHKTPIAFHDIDKEQFKEQLNHLICPTVDQSNIDAATDWMSNGLYKAAVQSKKSHETIWDTSISRWRRLLDHPDKRFVWEAINWKGGIDCTQPGKDAIPSDEQFKTHFEALLYSENESDLSSPEIGISPYIPLLDDPISENELQTSLNTLNPSKACDIKGNSPGLLTQLNATLFVFLLTLLNTILEYSHYPVAWSYSKLITIFKKGSRLLCGNYRGIAINEILFRVFDSILYRRLSLWYSPTRAQAGSQAGRGCLEQILTIRLLIDYAKKKRVKLFILFIDFEKAYDKLSRNKLTEELLSLGCGHVMLKMLVAMYSCTKFILKTTIFHANLGIKQGAATSSLLFIIYVDRMVKMISRSFKEDGFLGTLHVLMLMDDTVLLSTTKEGLRKKFEIVQQYCKEYNMNVNQLKTKFMVINKGRDDDTSILSEGLVIKYCKQYVYLGTTITDDGDYRSVIEADVKARMKSEIKYFTFLNRNPDLPFYMKKRVAEACVLSSILYGCEAYLCDDLGKLNSMYMGVVKGLLGVRKSTCNEICLLEADFPSLKSSILNKRHRYLNKKIPNLSSDDPLYMAIELVRQANTTSYRIIIRDMQQVNENIIQKERGKIQVSVRNTRTTKRQTYVNLNPKLCSPQIYTKVEIPEYKRVEYTRFRLSSHNLKIETGRWSRISRENRKCICEMNAIQSEDHVALECPLTAELRISHNIVAESLEQLFDKCTSETVDYIYKLKKMFDKLNKADVP